MGRFLLGLLSRSYPREQGARGGKVFPAWIGIQSLTAPRHRPLELLVGRQHRARADREAIGRTHFRLIVVGLSNGRANDLPRIG